jgi:hypothetical protein
MRRVVTGIALAAFARLVLPAGAQDVQHSWPPRKRPPKPAGNPVVLVGREDRIALQGRSQEPRLRCASTDRIGKVQKTPVVEPVPAEKKRRLKKNIVATKTGEMKEELEAAIALTSRGREPLRCSSPDTVKKGDALTLTFDSIVKSLRQIEVNTWPGAGERREPEGDNAGDAEGTSYPRPLAT